MQKNITYIIRRKKIDIERYEVLREGGCAKHIKNKIYKAELAFNMSRKHGHPKN